MEVRAPAVIKLLGEHAVVYGKMSLAVAINLFSKAKVSEGKTESFTIELKDFSKMFEFSEEEMRKIYADYKNRGDIGSYVNSHSAQYAEALPYVTIASRLLAEYGAKVAGIGISIESEIPVQKGLASSAACSTAFAVALLSYSRIRLSDAEIIEVARDGDRVIHKNEGAGKIDVNTSFYGGLISYSSESGARKERLGEGINLLLIDTGPKKSTAETVGHVAELYNAERENTEKLLDGIDRCSREGIEALGKNDIKGFGSCMFRDHELLRQLGVSSDGLDRVVGYAKEAKAYGAKLSGGGGGGLAIAVDNNSHSLENLLASKSFNVSKASVSSVGASSYISSAAHEGAQEG